MHIFSKKEIDQAQSLVVVFSELSELDKAAAEIKGKADYDSELFTKKESLQLYRQALAAGGALKHFSWPCPPIIPTRPADSSRIRTKNLTIKRTRKLLNPQKLPLLWQPACWQQPVS